jgi:hypothetical protein
VDDADREAEARDAPFDQARDVRPGALGGEPHPDRQHQLAALKERRRVLELADRDPPHRCVPGHLGQRAQPEPRQRGDLGERGRHLDDPNYWTIPTTGRSLLQDDPYNKTIPTTGVIRPNYRCEQR